MIIDLLNRYIWIVDTIMSAGAISREELNLRWSRSRYNEKHESFIPVRTFHHDREAIAMMFNVDIECDKHRNVYYIANAAEIQQDGLRRWMISSFSVMQMIDESANLRDRIVYEEIPSGEKYLTVFAAAMRDNFRLQITHKPFFNKDGYTTVISPYCLKVFKQRWYVAGVTDKYPNEIRVYALDRLQDVKSTEEHFELPSGFTAKGFFQYSYGVFHSNEPKEVLIRVDEKSVPYIDTVKLHPSQEKIEEHDSYCVYRYFIAPTFDFLIELRSFGSSVEVLSPIGFRNEMIDDIKLLAAKYNII